MEESRLTFWVPYILGALVTAALFAFSFWLDDWWNAQPAEWRAQKIAAVAQWSERMNTRAERCEEVLLTDGQVIRGRVDSEFGQSQMYVSGLVNGMPMYATDSGPVTGYSVGAVRIPATSVVLVRPCTVVP